MAYFDDRLNQTQKKFQDYLDSEPRRIASEETKSRDYLSGLDVQANNRTSDLLTQLSGRLGIDTGSASDVKTPGALAKREEALGRQSFKRMSEYYTRLYNYAYDKYLNAGYDLQKSQEFARQWAKDQSEMKFQADMAESNRDFMRRKTEISNQFADRGLQASGSNPYEQALYRSLFGLGTTAAVYRITKSRPEAPSNFNSKVVGQGDTLSERSGFIIPRS